MAHIRMGMQAGDSPESKPGKGGPTISQPLVSLLAYALRIKQPTHKVH